MNRELGDKSVALEEQPTGSVPVAGAHSRKKVVVIGDWVIDERWVTSIHRSKTRSRAGINHYRSLQEPEGCVLALAGAGKTCSILYEARNGPDGNERGFDLMAVGNWHPEDESTLAHLLRADAAVGQAHHRLTYPAASQPPDVTMFNPASQEDTPCTTRVIRVYQQTGSEYVLLDRIDWELPHSESHRLNEPVLGRLANHLADVDAIVIKDMAKGTIDGSIITWLRRAVGQDQDSGSLKRHPAWFISTKKWLPDWHEKLPQLAVRLFIVPQVAAHAAAEEPTFSRWITGDESVTKEALDCMAKLAGRFPAAMICVLPHGLCVLARVPCGKETLLLKQPVVGEGLQNEGLPMASVFLPALVAFMLEESVHQDADNSPRSGLDNSGAALPILAAALNFTERWMRFEAGRIVESKTWRPTDIQRLRLVRALNQDLPSDGKRSFLPRWSTESWDRSLDEWNQAYHERGVIRRPNDDGTGVLEIKRATVEIDGYVCCVQQKREVLHRLAAEIQSFNRADRISKAFMLKAQPGAGKSYLVEKLAELYRLTLLQFNITSLLYRGDLLDCFDTIVTTQARARHGRYLVFFDEIDARLDGQPVYDAFLRPLEDSLYVRAGKAFYLDPCIWIFAGTHDPSKDNGFQGEGTRKGSDCVSRLSEYPLTFDYTWQARDEFKNDGLARIENVYAGAALLKRAFPNITQISEAVLEAFRVIPPKTGIRKIDRLVRRFDQIQYGKVTLGNLPQGWNEHMGVSPQGMLTWMSGRDSLKDNFIRIL